MKTLDKFANESIKVINFPLNTGKSGRQRISTPLFALYPITPRSPQSWKHSHTHPPSTAFAHRHTMDSQEISRSKYLQDRGPLGASPKVFFWTWRVRKWRSSALEEERCYQLEWLLCLCPGIWPPSLLLPFHYPSVFHFIVYYCFPLLLPQIWSSGTLL